MVMPSGARDLSFLLCYQFQLFEGFSIQFQLWQLCILLGNFFGVKKSSDLFLEDLIYGEIMFWLRG